MKSEKLVSAKIRVAILEDHQSIIDGYFYRLNCVPQLEIVGTARFGEELETLLTTHPADVLFMDVHVPTTLDNPAPFPILQVIPKLLQSYPHLAILVISMLTERALIQAVIDAGASGYLLKDDRAAIEQLGAIVLSVSSGGIYLSQQASQQLLKRQHTIPEPLLTPRQQEVISLCAAYPDWSCADLAVHLGVSHSTVRNLLSNAYLRLSVRSLAAAVVKARQLGLITPLFLTMRQ